MARRRVVLGKNSFGWTDPDGGQWTVTLIWAEVGGRPEVVDIHLTNYRLKTGDRPGDQIEPWSEPPGRWSAANWRALNLGEKVEKGRSHYARKLARLQKTEEVLGEPIPIPERLDRRGRPVTLDAEHYRKVARVYLEAWRAGLAPRQAVCDAFEVAPSTAATWIRRARQLSILPDKTESKSTTKRRSR